MGLINSFIWSCGEFWRSVALQSCPTLCGNEWVIGCGPPQEGCVLRQGSNNCSTRTPSRGDNWRLASDLLQLAFLEGTSGWYIFMAVTYLLVLVKLHCFEHLLYLVPKESIRQHFESPMPTECPQNSLFKDSTAFHSALYELVGTTWVIIMKYCSSWSIP